MRIGIFGMSVNDGTIDRVIDEARDAEVGGFSSYWAPQIFGHDALTALAVAGREVPRIELGTSVVPTFPRHPMALAQQALTVNAACGGRLCLGIGLSHQVVIESMMGLSFEKPVRHLHDYLSVLIPLLHEQKVSYDGDAYRAHAAITVNGGTPPDVVVAALGPQLLGVAGRLADGTLTWCVGPNTLRDFTVPTITAAAEAAGRPAPRIIAALPVTVTADPAAARERAAAMLAMYGQLPSYRAMLDREGVAGPADLSILGSEQQVVDGVAALAEVGVTDFAASEIGATADEREATRAALRQLV
jgi:5,10-methylenetetrahydromethanopterin reductase